MKYRFTLGLIILLALGLRIYGLNWDQNQHLHPDERFLTMVTAAAKLPPNVGDYLDPAVSTLNPYNLDFNFYVYGTFPMTFIKVLAVVSGMDNYHEITLIGRMMSAFADVGTLVLLFMLVRIWQKRYSLPTWLPHMSAFLYAIAVLPIQQSHFFTVDTFATFFIFVSLVSASLYVHDRKGIRVVIGAIGMGLAMASKVSSIYVIPLIVMMYVLGLMRSQEKRKPLCLRALKHGLLGVIIGYSTLRFADPRIFESASWFKPALNSHFLNNLEELKRLTNISAPFPPTLQWVQKEPILFPLKNMALFGVGLPYFILSLVGLGMAFVSKKKELILLGVWCVWFFLYQGSRSVMTMRYFYTLYPFLAFFAGWVIIEAVGGLSVMQKRLSIAIICLIVTIWPYAFMSMYSKPHTRVQASEWIFSQIPAGSKILVEHWDDALPLSFAPEKEHPLPRLSQQYTLIELPVFDPDSDAKRAHIEEKLQEADYYVLSSNRGYGSVLPLPDRYPYMSQLYTALFSGGAGYQQVAEFSSVPTVRVGQWAITIPDQSAEEAFTVYDHPTVIIFRNVRK